MTNQREIVAKIRGMRAIELLQLILNTGSKLQSSVDGLLWHYLDDTAADLLP